MTHLIVILHVIAAVLLMGPVTIAVSMFPPQLLKASAGDATAKGAAGVLHSITNTYGMWSVMVPVLGAAALFIGWENFGHRYQFHTALILALAAWLVLFFLVTPKQKKAMEALTAGDQTFDFTKAKKQLSMFSGIFCLLWIITALLMFNWSF